MIDQREFSLFRYREFFPIKNELWRDISLGEGLTKSVKFDDSLYLKVDYAMPTLSFKDRGAVMLIWFCKTHGIKKILQDSSGNAGNSVAAYAARAGIECEIYVPKGTSEKKIKMLEYYGAKAVVFDGTRDETADACRKRAKDEGIFTQTTYLTRFFTKAPKHIYMKFTSSLALSLKISFASWQRHLATWLRDRTK
ncbi:pyridoxal-phosphate dependent enzyme [Campylobacter concisus]